MSRIFLAISNDYQQNRNLLIAGMGGGFDIFCGLPTYFELERRGQTVHLANYSLTPIAEFEEGIRLTDTHSCSDYGDYHLTQKRKIASYGFRL